MATSGRDDPKLHAVGRRTACYFCGDFFPERLLQDHVSQCESVLEPCPRRCGVYVRRGLRDKHAGECPRRGRPLSMHGEGGRGIGASEEEKRQKYELQIDLLRSRKLEQKVNDMTMALEEFHLRYYEETNRTTKAIAELRRSIENATARCGAMEAVVERAGARTAEGDRRIVELERAVSEHERQLRNSSDMETVSRIVCDRLRDEQIARQNDADRIDAELCRLREYLVRDNAAVGALWEDQKDQLEELRAAVEAQIDALAEFKAKQQAVAFETRALARSAAETEDRLATQANRCRTIEATLAQLKSDVETEPTPLPGSCRCGRGATVQDGHFLWRIDNFAEKMSAAKESDTVLRSETFYSRPYGYKLRLVVHLNGLKRWKGRHAIVSLQVLKGEWDPLLRWPCHIEARVALVDQVPHAAADDDDDDGAGGKGDGNGDGNGDGQRRRREDKVRPLTARRLLPDDESDEPHESSTEHVFITHSTFEKRNYLKEDRAFLEVTVTAEK